MNNKDFMKAFLTATDLLPQRLWRLAFQLTPQQRVLCEELRLRAGRPMTAVTAGKSILLSDTDTAGCVTPEEIQQVLAVATESSLHTYNEQIRQGFITTSHGHRLGLCGEAVMQNGQLSTLRNISSVNLRIAKQAIGLAAPLIGQLYPNGFESTLVISAPGGGKTTLLRDLARLLSGTYRISIADERYELAACRLGSPGFDIGLCDVASGGDKAQLTALLTKSMSPQIIVLDEITQQQDAEALLQAAYNGCDFLTAVHAKDITELEKRPVYRLLLQEELFRRIIVIRQQEGHRQYQIFSSGGMTNAENDRCCDDHRIMLGHRFFYEQRTA